MTTDTQIPKKISQTLIMFRFILIGIFWTFFLLLLSFSTSKRLNDNTNQVTLAKAKTVFNIVQDIRAWNAFHGGLYAPITEKMQPNPYLKIPNRDITTQKDQKLTLINPAFMTRQLSEIVYKNGNIQFHITSLKPIRPANQPALWEEKALQTFTQEKDTFYEWHIPKNGKKEFRYIAPLFVKQSCLKCHSVQGYKVGDLRGGISVSIPAETILKIKDKTNLKSFLTFFGIWLIGILGIGLTYKKTIKDFNKQDVLFNKLHDAFDQIKTLKGIIPICASCKKIRTDSGIWEQVEKYISEHSDALFSHGICPECMKKLYPQIDDKKKGDSYK